MADDLPAELPTLPQAAVRILEMLREPDVSIHKLVRAIELAPGIALRLLRFSNSAFIGSARQITTVRQALLFMGLKNAKMTTLGFCLANIFPKNRTFDFDWCWQRNTINAAVVRRLAQETSVQSEDAFLGGISQDIGLLVRGEMFGKEFQSLIEICKATGQPIEELEREAFGNDHAEIAAKLVTHWQFPEIIIEGVSQHHAGDEASPLGQLLGAAESLTNFILKNTSDNLVRYRTALARIDISSEKADMLVAEFEPLVVDLAQMLDIPLTFDQSFTELVAEAQQQLVTMSMEAASDQMSSQREAERLREVNRALAEEAYIDELTGLGNRRKFDMVLEAELEVVKQTGKPLTLIMCDIDDFKVVNDTCGHTTGDHVLAKIGELLRNSAREDDTPCRYGGEEFGILQSNTLLADGVRLADHLRTAISDLQFPSENLSERITISFGVATFEGASSITPEELIEAADQSLYEAKQAGKNCVKEYSRAL